MALPQLQTILPLFNSASKQQGSEVFSSVHWFGKNMVELFLEKMIPYRQDIFYAAIAFSVALAVAALFAKTILVLVFLVGAVGCFSLAVWTFRARETKISDDLGRENERLGKALVAGDCTLAEERKNAELLKEANRELGILIQAQDVQITKQQELMIEQDMRLQEAKDVNESVQSENTKLNKILAYFKEKYPHYFLSRS